MFSNQIHGAYYEFGVYQGDSFRASHRIYPGCFQWQQQQLSAPDQWRKAAGADYAQYHHHFYAFDTFQGMPENEEESPTFRDGDYSCSLEEFARPNRSDGIQEGDRVRYFSGTFAEIKERSQKELDELQPAASVNLECDLYSSTIDDLDIVGPKLVQGTVLMVDDWNHFAADRGKGQRKAFSEFLDPHPGVNFESWFPYQFVGQSFISAIPAKRFWVRTGYLCISGTNFHYDAITSVNIIRLSFNQYSGDFFELIPDRSYYNPDKNSRFTRVDVADQLK